MEIRFDIEFEIIFEYLYHFFPTILYPTIDKFNKILLFITNRNELGNTIQFEGNSFEEWKKRGSNDILYSVYSIR